MYVYMVTAIHSTSTLITRNMTCSLLLRQAPSLVSSYLKTTTKPPLSIVKASSFSSSSEKHSPCGSIKTSSSPPPWLMLTPEIDLRSGTDTVFKFYSLAEDIVISVDRKNLKAQLGLESKERVDLECKGSSHGWLVLFDRCSSDLFLYNPLSNRHLKLPTIRNLEAIPKNYLETGFLCVNKLIISSSDPEGDANCRALMIHGDRGNLAFCCPNSSDEWVETYYRYDDVAACGGGNNNLFFGINDDKPNGPHWPYPEFEGWDLRDVSRPMLISLEDRLVKDFGKTFPWRGYGPKKEWMSREANFLVPAADKDMYYVCLNDGDLDLNEEGNYHFHVHKFDFESGKLVHMDRSLDGLALFVGRSHSFALPAAEFPKVLEPDSIYFTHPEDCYTSIDDEPLGRKHIKAYNYGDGTFSPPFYTFKKKCVEGGIEMIQKPPMWYTPTCAAALF